ncbi:hypothetical protein HT102_11260 [Hoyosella sp. G463]|uniref:Alpha/beta hydrolase n=1 Tax=Lolliginicoccus lacisalsi TaxID=2742202 RepID=A0A927PN04_9ACTN|nr:hypothetical protein [Lolliginicoccus lacisalsi]MBD8507066.1 hypothetical protein [Lolliginicoccus lacisalsi]
MQQEKVPPIRRRSILACASAAVLATILATSHSLALAEPGRQSDPRKHAAVHCDADLTMAPDTMREPVLLVPPTETGIPRDHPLIAELVNAGHTTCILTVPRNAATDSSRASRHVFDTLRAMIEIHSDKISIVTIGSGALPSILAIGKWPAAAHVVKDLVAISPDLDPRNRTTLSNARSTGLETTFIVSGTDAAGVAHTVDDLLPQPESPLRIVRTQDVCGPYFPEALALQATWDTFVSTGEVSFQTLAADPVAQLLAIDALASDGPAEPRRVPRSACP